MQSQIILAIFIVVCVVCVIFNDRIEPMTLKTDCNVERTSCLIACKTNNLVVFEKCFDECEKNSPIC